MPTKEEAAETVCTNHTSVPGGRDRAAGRWFQCTPEGCANGWGDPSAKADQVTSQIHCLVRQIHTPWASTSMESLRVTQREGALNDGAQEDDRQESGVGGGESSQRPEEYESRKVSSGVGPVSEDGKITSQGKNVEPRLVLIEWLDSYGYSAPWQVVDMVSVDPLILPFSWLAVAGQRPV